MVFASHETTESTMLLLAVLQNMKEINYPYSVQLYLYVPDFLLSSCILYEKYLIIT